MQLLIKYILMGIVQGITEPLPISSSGHLVLLKSIIDVESTGAVLELMVHFGSLIAIFYYYRKDIVQLIKSGLNFIFRRDKSAQSDFNYILKLIIATIPAGIIGILFKDRIEEIMSRPMFVGFALLLTALIIFVACKFTGNKDDQGITYNNAIIIGLMQAVALLPGVSRSGSTTCAGMAQNISRESAMKFSFLLFIPIGFLACLSGIPDLLSMDLSIYGLPLLGSLVASTICTYIALLLLKKLLTSNNYIYFSYYCLVVGLIAIIFIK